MKALEICLLITVAGALTLWLFARIAYYLHGSSYTSKNSFRQFNTYHFGTGKNYLNFTDYAIKAAAAIYIIYSIWHRF